MLVEHEETDLIRQQTLALTRRITGVFKGAAAKTNTSTTNLVLIATGVGFLMACALKPAKIADAILIIQLVFAPLPKLLKHARWLIFTALFSSGFLRKTECILMFGLLQVTSYVDFSSAWTVIKGAKGIMI
jgi:hypothetical protein